MRILILVLGTILATSAYGMSVEIKADDGDVTLDYFVREYGWTKDNPLSKLEFAKKQVSQFIQDTATAYDLRPKVEAVRAKAVEDGKATFKVD